MKNILIVSDSLRVGGIQKSLINMLNNLDYTKYNVDVLLFDDSESDLINKNIKVLKSNNILRIIGSTSSQLKKKSFFKFFLRKVLSLLCRIFGSNFIFSILFKSIKINQEYDIAISYSNNVNEKSLYFGYNKFVVERIKAKNKMCWIHIDYILKKRNKIEKKEFEKMDKIILVSKACKNNFDRVYPEYKNKTFVVYNIIEKEEILKLSNENNTQSNDNIFTIISICRIEKNKNVDDQVDIAYKLYQNNLKFKWIVIGNGVDYLRIKEKVKKLNLDDYFSLIGEKKNVYPYIKNSNLLVSTSLSESFGLTIAEALNLDVPVLSLKYPSLVEISSQNVLCENCDEMYKQIKCMIENNEFYRKFSTECYYKITDETIHQQLNEVLEEKND